MWKPFKCRLFREHDYKVCSEPGALYLECRRCGYRSSGWQLFERRVNRANSPLRLFLAESGEPTLAFEGDADSEVWANSIESGELRLTFGQRT